MTTARKRIVDPDICRLYHITGRCVQRAFLCGFDKATGIDYEYRRQWVIDRLETLALAFCIDVVAYAIMSNHVMRLRLAPSFASENRGSLAPKLTLPPRPPP